MSLTSLHIKDFQAHTDLTVTLDPGITTIVGPSDVGKSAIIRALRWASQNTPSGEAFLRSGAKRVEVVLEVDGQRIARGRGKGGNTYDLNDKRFEAFGNEVPPEVVSLLRLSPMNFQGQHDGPFWLQETAGEVSRQLNRMVNLDVMDKALSSVDSMLRGLRAQEDVGKTRLEQAIADRKRLKFARRMDAELKSLTLLHQTLEKTAANRARIGLLAGDAQRHTETEKTAARAAEAGKTVVQTGSQWGERMKTRKRLESLLKTARSLRESASRTVPDVRGLEGLCRAWEKARSARRELASGIRNATDKQKDVADLTKALERDSAKLKERMGDQCPLCGQALPVGQ